MVWGVSGIVVGVCGGERCGCGVVWLRKIELEFLECGCGVVA